MGALVRFHTWRYASRSPASPGRLPRRERCLLHTQAHCVALHGGFVERDIVHDEKSTGSSIQGAERAERCPSVNADAV